MDNCFDFGEALKTEAGRKMAVHLIVAYMSMLTNDERLDIMDNFCTVCGNISPGCDMCEPDR